MIEGDHDSDGDNDDGSDDCVRICDSESDSDRVGGVVNDSDRSDRDGNDRPRLIDNIIAVAFGSDTFHASNVNDVDDVDDSDTDDGNCVKLCDSDIDSACDSVGDAVEPRPSDNDSEIGCVALSVSRLAVRVVGETDAVTICVILNVFCFATLPRPRLMDNIIAVAFGRDTFHAAKLNGVCVSRKLGK